MRISFLWHPHTSGGRAPPLIIGQAQKLSIDLKLLQLFVLVIIHFCVQLVLPCALPTEKRLHSRP